MEIQGVTPLPLALIPFKKPKLSASDDPSSALIFTLNVISCGCCRRILDSCIYQCRNYHIVCLDCRTKEARWCSCPGTVESFRNGALERLVGCFSTECSNAAFGCIDTFPVHKRKAHEAKCCFSPQMCPRCSFTGAAWQFCSHFSTQHGWNTVEVSDYGVRFGIVVNANEERIVPVRIGSSNSMFLIHVENWESFCRVYPSHVARRELDKSVKVRITVVEQTAKLMLKCPARGVSSARDGPLLLIPRQCMLLDGRMRIEGCVERA